MMQSSTPQSASVSHPHDQLIQLISPWLAPLGYQIIHIEVQSHRQKVLRLFIDTLEPSTSGSIGIEDCVKVSRELDEKLDQLPEIQAVLPGAYELEVSSPGIDRPLRTQNDFQRFAGQSVRIHLYRPLTSEEIENPTYQEKNPKQKNFLGTLMGLQNSKVVLSLVATNEKGKQRSSKKSKAKAELTTNSAEGLRVAIPLPLISKANLEPDLNFEDATKESHEL